MSVRTLEQELRYTWLSVSKMYNEEASKYGGSMAVGFALLSLNPKEDTPSTSLGPKMGMESTSLSRTLRFMEDENLIQRIPNPEDGRGVLIKLTERGMEFRNYARELVMKFNKTITNEVGEDSVKNFYQVVDRINKLIKNKEIFVTTAKKSINKLELRKYLFSGSLFSVKTNVRGQTQKKFILSNAKKRLILRKNSNKTS